MVPLVRRSILKKFLFVVSCILLVCIHTPATAQRATGHAAGGEVRFSPPVPHISISSAPRIHAPLSAPRISARSSAGALRMAGFLPPRRPIRRFPPAFVVYESPLLYGGPFWGLNSCLWATCDLFWSWTLDYTEVSSPSPTNYVSQVYETPVYDYGEERLDRPQLVLKDGTVLNVTDYWLIDDQLHFAMIEEVGTKPAEHVIPFEELDLQTTTDANARRGFSFVLRDEPIEQYLRDHPDGSLPAVTRPHE
jgi:hypothetical protein